jgi:hypothetical protein
MDGYKRMPRANAGALISAIPALDRTGPVSCERLDYAIECGYELIEQLRAPSVVRALQARTREKIEASASRCRSRGLVRVAALQDAPSSDAAQARADELARDVLDLVAALEVHGGGHEPTAVRAEHARVINGTGFDPLPKEERGHGVDDLCCCPYCSPVPGEARDNPDGVWDTLATDLDTGKTWKVHFPELHGRRRKRAQQGTRRSRS